MQWMEAGVVQSGTGGLTGAALAPETPDHKVEAQTIPIPSTSPMSFQTAFMFP